MGLESRVRVWKMVSEDYFKVGIRHKEVSLWARSKEKEVK
jgi:hypothetical protein